MKAGLICLAWLAVAAAINLQASDSDSPTTKVVKLLKSMQESVASEAKADEETYDKFKCWCHDNTDAKTKAVNEAEATSRELHERVEVLLAKTERLTGEIETAEDEVAKNQAALDTAVALRKQQYEEYLDDRKRLEGDLSGVESAKTALTNPETGSFLQAKSSVARPLLQQLAKNDRVSNADRETIQSFLQRGDGVDGVLGVLTGLKDDFSEEMVQLNKAESTSLQQYEELSTAKKTEIKAGEGQVESKKEERAATRQEHAIKKQEIKDTEALMGTDLSFVDEVKKQCAEMDAEWEERQKIRADEAEGISKAIEILDADEAHANFQKTFAGSFLQESAEPSSSRAARASRVLTEAGRGDPRLAMLAMQTNIDKFVKVKKAMDDMVLTLTKEQEDEVKQKDFCVKEFQENEVETADKTRLKTSLLAKEQAIDLKKPQTEIETFQGEVEEMQKQLKIAGENREKENEEFQQVVQEQRQTQKLLTDALEVLGKFYKKDAFLQVHARAGPDSPGGFKDYKANGKSFGVLSMLQKLIADSKAMEAESVRAEKSAQKAYEAFSADTTASVEKKEKAISSKKGEKAGLEKTLVQTRKGREGAEAALDNLADTKAGLHESCDFLVKNFEARQAARTEEMESVKKAKAILSGANFAEIQLY